jgi:hypothetical protein
MNSTELLRLAADALEDGQVPLTDPFLSDNGVTLDEAFSLAEQLAIGARIVATAIEDPLSVQAKAFFRTIAESL